MADNQSVYRNRIVRQGMADVQGVLFNESNIRIHPRFQQLALSGLLEEVGWLQTVIINLRTDESWGESQNVETLLDGHLRVLLADRHDEPQVPATWVDLKPEEERLALLTFDPVGALAAVDKEKTEKLLAEAKTKNEAVKAMLDGIAKKQQALWQSITDTAKAVKVTEAAAVGVGEAGGDGSASGETNGKKLGRDDKRYHFHFELDFDTAVLLDRALKEYKTRTGQEQEAWIVEMAEGYLGRL